MTSEVQSYILMYSLVPYLAFTPYSCGVQGIHVVELNKLKTKVKVD